jgi:hypothetical protein
MSARGEQAMAPIAVWKYSNRPTGVTRLVRLPFVGVNIESKRNSIEMSIMPASLGRDANKHSIESKDGLCIRGIIIGLPFALTLWAGIIWLICRMIL